MQQDMVSPPKRCSQGDLPLDCENERAESFSSGDTWRLKISARTRDLCTAVRQTKDTYDIGADNLHRTDYQIASASSHETVASRVPSSAAAPRGQSCRTCASRPRVAVLPFLALQPNLGSPQFTIGIVAQRRQGPVEFERAVRHSRDSKMIPMSADTGLEHNRSRSQSARSLHGSIRAPAI